MKKCVIGIVGIGMIGNSTAVLTTLHGCKTICYARNESKIPGYRAGFDKMYTEMITQGILTKEQAEIIEEAARLAQEDANKISDQKAAQATEYLEEAGMEIVTPSEEDYSQMREMCMPVWDTIREDCGSELFDEYTAIVKEEQ